MYKFTVLFFTLLATSANAQDIELSFFEKVRLQNACRADIERICSGIEPGGGRILDCVKEKKDQLSEGCSTTMKEVFASKTKN